MFLTVKEAGLARLQVWGTGPADLARFVDLVRAGCDRRRRVTAVNDRQPVERRVVFTTIIE